MADIAGKAAGPPVLPAAAVAAGTGLLDDGLEYRRGRVDGAEFIRRIAVRTATATVSAVLAKGVFLALAVSFLAVYALLMPILSAVAVVGPVGPHRGGGRRRGGRGPGGRVEGAPGRPRGGGPGQGGAVTGPRRAACLSS